MRLSSIYFVVESALAECALVESALAECAVVECAVAECAVAESAENDIKILVFFCCHLWYRISTPRRRGRP